MGLIQVAWYMPPRPSASVVSPVSSISTAPPADTPTGSAIASTSVPPPTPEAVHPSVGQSNEEMEAPRPKDEEPGRQDDDDGWGASSFDE